MPAKKRATPAPRPAKPELRIQYMRLDELRRRPGNPKGHDVGALNLSMERFGSGSL